MNKTNSNISNQSEAASAEAADLVRRQNEAFIRRISEYETSSGSLKEGSPLPTEPNSPQSSNATQGFGCEYSLPSITGVPSSVESAIAAGQLALESLTTSASSSQSLGLPKEAKERKATPIYSGVLAYFPLALAEVSRVSKAGSAQHGHGDKLYWEKGKSTDHADSLVRHLMEAGTVDTDGQLHTAKAAWRALALLQTELENSK